MTCNFGGQLQNYLTTPEAFCICSIVSGLCFSFPNKFAQDLLDDPGKMSVFLIFYICNANKIFAYD